MGHFLRHTWEMLLERPHGPFALRLILQPLMATLIAIRAGLRDARTGRPAYGWEVIANPRERRELLREGWHELARVFVLAVLVDLIYEVIVFHRIYPGQSIMVAAVLALLPYPLIRGVVNRFARRRHHGVHELRTGDFSRPLR
jgi:hypothetical protein